MNDKREQLYNNLLGSGMVDESNIGTIDEFKGAIKDEQSARQFYNNLVGFGFNDSQIGSEDDFYNSISSDFQPQQETYPQEVEDAYNDPKNAAPYFKDKSQLNKEFQNGNMTVGNDKPSFWERMFSMDNLNAAGKAFNSHVTSNAQTPYQEPTPKPAEEEVHYNTPKPQQVVVGRGEEPSLEQIQMAADSSKQVQQTIQQQKQWKAEDEAMDFVPKKVETEKDILDNAQGRFAMTEEGKALKAEADEAMQGYVDQLSEEFKESPEYKELTKVQPKNQQELDELNKKLNEAFQQKYETQLDEFAQPYEKKMGDALFNRYGDDIDNQLKKLGAKNAEEDLSRISGEVDDMYKKKVGTWDDEKKRLAAKFGQHRVNLTEQDKEAYENAVANDADLRNLTASKHLIEESNEIVNAVKNGDEAALKQMFRGLWDNLDARNFTFGLSEMADNATILQALQKAEKGEKLTDAEEKLLEAQVTNMAVKGYYAEQLSLGYKVGQTTGASLPFMLEFIANPIARSGNAIAKGLLKYGMKQAGKRLGLGAAKALNTAPVKFAGRLVGDALAASGMLATTSMPGVTADTMERLSNNYEVKMEDGEPVVTMKDKTVTPFDAWSDAMQNRFIENQSEMVFNAFKGFNPFGQVKLPNNVASFINMVRESAPGRLYRNILGNKTLREFAQAAQFHGLPEEYLEEVYNNFANVLTGEMDAKDALSLDRNIETFLGLVPTSLMFGALGVGSYARERRAFREKYGKMTDEQKEKYEYLREMAKNGKKSLNREVKRFLNETFNADNLTPEERRSEIEFLFDSVKGITMEEIDAERTPEQKVQDGVEEAEMDGAEAVEPADMNRIGVDLEVATQEMDNIFGATTRTMFDADPMAAAADVMNNPNYTAEEKQVAIDYLNAKTAYNSMIGRIREDIGREVEKSNAEIDNRTDAETGAVRPATLKNGNRQVYIMNGNVVMYEDGSGVDLGNSSKDVIVKDAETGKLEFIPASDISSIEQPIPAEQLKEETAANIQQTKAQEEADKINGTLAFQQGDTYQAMGEDGIQVELTIISDNGDGSVNVGINGEAAAVPMAKETVQQMADRFKQQQAQKASIERRAATAVEEQATKPVAAESVEQAPVQEEVAPVAEETAAETAPEAVEEQEEPMPMMGEGENIQPDYGSATPQRTSRYIYDENGLDEQDANQLVQMKRKAAEKVLSDTKKAKPEFGDKGIGDNIVKLKQARAAWEQSVADAQRQVDYWNAVEQEHAMAVRQREEAANQAAQQPVVQEEAPVVEHAPAEQQEAVETPAAEAQKQSVETAPAEAEVTERNRVEEQPVDEKEPLRERAREWEKKVGVKVTLVESVDELPQNSYAALAIREGKNVQGWYNIKQDKIYIYVPNVKSESEIDKTYMHEVVAHKGLRQLLGKDAFNKLCDDVFASMSEKDKKYFMDYPGVKVIKGKERERAAADEYIAFLSEYTDLNPTLWEKIVAAIREALRELGIDVRMTNDDIEYILDKSLNNLMSRAEENRKITTNSSGQMQNGQPIRFSVSSVMEGAGFEASEIDAEGNKTSLEDKDGNVIIRQGKKVFSAKNPITVKDIENDKNSTLNIMLDLALDAKTITKKKAAEMRRKYADIVNMYLEEGSAENGGFEGLSKKWMWLGDTVFKTVATNSDAQYSYSLDITRVCKKNEAVIRAISALQRQQGYGATPAQIMDIYESTHEAGYQVPCPVCYVFSRYLRNGKYASAAVNGMVKYGDHLQGGKDPWTVEQWKAELDRLTKAKKDSEKTVGDANEVISTIFNEIDKRGMRLLSKNVSEEEKKQLRDEIVALDRQYRAALDVANQQSLTNWINSFAIHSVNNKMVMYDDARKPENMEEFRDNALDIRKVGETMRYYPAIQRLRKSGGAAAGKEITFESDNELGELVSGVGTSSPSSATNWFKAASDAKSDEERNAMMKEAKNRFANAVLYAHRQSLRGGQRMWSWSDNIESLAPDVAVNLMQLEMLGGALQSYSKQLEGVALVASMDGYVNGSLLGKDNGWQEVSDEQVEVVDGKTVLKDDIKETISEPTVDGRVDRERILAQKGSPIYEENGKKYVLIFDDVLGIDPYGREKDGKHLKGLFDLNSELDRAGNILVGMNDLHVRASMADDRIFFIIPWHASGQSVHILKSMLGILGTKLENFKPVDYTKMQEEKNYGKKVDGKYPKVPAKVVEIWESHKNEEDYKSGIGAIESGHDGGLSEGQMEYSRLRKAIFDGSVENSPEDLKKVKRDAFLSQVYAKVKANAGTMTSNDNEFVYPYEYWDESSTYDTADVNGERYVEYCRRLGIAPKFSGKWNNGNWSDEGNFIDDKGYWKLLVDRRMYDTKGNFQDLTPTNVDGFTTDMVDPSKTQEKYVSTQVADDKATQGIVDDVLKRESDRAALAGRELPTANYDMTMEEAVDAYNEVKEGIRFRISDEERKIEKDAKADGTWMKAPNGQPSNLSERQWVQVRTKAFKNWFGDWENNSENASKVVDENGEPKVVYHNTDLNSWLNRENEGKPFNIFNAGRVEGTGFFELAHFGTKEQAEKRTEYKVERNKLREELGLEPAYKVYQYTVYLNAKNLKRVKDFGGKEEAWWDAAIKAQEDGYDGLVYSNEHEGKGDSYAVFSPNQIKSATENEGTFDESNPDIRFRVTPEEDAEYMSAVESGDMEKAADMVKAAAKKAMPDTKVVDENGNPLVVYHGSPVIGITAFDRELAGTHAGAYGDDAIYGTDSEGVADIFSHEMLPGSTKFTNRLGKKGKIYPLFMDIQNPFDLRQVENSEEMQDVLRSMPDIGDGQFFDSIMRGIKEGNHQLAKTFIDYQRLQELKYDGIIARMYSKKNGNNALEYGAFEPNSTKSAEPVTYDDEGNVIPLSQRFNDTSDDIRFRVSEKEDEDYMKAVEEGDNAKASKMVEEAAKAAGYTHKAYRVQDDEYLKSEDKNPNEYSGISEGVYYAESLDYYDNTSTGYKKDDAKPYYINTSNFFDPMKTMHLDANAWSDIRGHLDEFEKYGIADEMDYDGAENEAMTSTYGLAYAGKRLGYDGTILRDIPQAGSRNLKGFTEYAVYNSNAIKSADTVVYDDNGNVIPLSERFNPENSDIRFRVNDDKTLMGVHNISETKLKKAIKNGGLANPSLAVIDTRNGMHNDFGEISLIPKSSLIDKRTGRNAGTYAGDAWTPSYPTVEKRMTDKGESQSWKDMREAMNGEDERGIMSETRRIFNDYLQDNRSPDRLAYWFFKEKGVQPEIIRYDSGVSEEDKQLFNEHVGDARSFTELDEQGRDVVLRLMANAEGKTVEDMLATYQRIKENMQRKLVEDPKPMFKVTRERTIEQIENYGIITSNADNVMGRVRAAMYQDGKVNVQETLLNAVNQMREDNQNEFDNWLDGKEQKYGVEEYIFNGYTPSGKRRYVQNTVENVSKLMNKESERNAGNDTGFGAFRSIVMEKYGSLAEIRRNKDKLKKGDDIKEEVDKMSDELFGIIKQLADMKELSSNPFTNVSYADARLQEAVATSDPIGHLNRVYGYNIPKDGEFAKELNDIIAKVVTTPVKYFETKFNRPVRLNEFAIAVVPENTSEDVVKALQDAGLDVRTYDGTEEGRTNATMEAVNDRDDIRFRVSEEESAMRDALADKLNEVGIETSVAPVYYSNAEKAVQDIKQEKATPEQWLKMIEKNGGLKAGEDKWTGLSDWLKNSKAKSLTKQEVIDYIRKNAIIVNDVDYLEDVKDAMLSNVRQAYGDEMADWFDKAFDVDYDGQLYVNNEAVAANMYEKYTGNYIELDEYGDLSPEDNDAIMEWAGEKHRTAEEQFGVKTIDEVRRNYTTNGLDNKREIALTVPTIEPWNERDEIHFGDAGEGRAVAWVRFGDTTNIEKDPELQDAGRKLNDFESDMQEKYDTAGNDLLERLTPEERTRYDELVADVESHRREKRVLVIDEIQSKRHQEGREKGYANNVYNKRVNELGHALSRGFAISEEEEKEIEELMQRPFKEGEEHIIPIGLDIKEDDNQFYTEFAGKTYSVSKDLVENMSRMDAAKYLTAQAREDVNAHNEKVRKGIPDAPFEKNWHELAMKRMLRYAAENGYDKIAWTKGNQQAERYDIGGVVKSVEAPTEWKKDSEGTSGAVRIIFKDGNRHKFMVDKETGNITYFPSNTDAEGKHITEVLGKDLGEKVLNAEEGQTFSGEDLRIGGEGMRGFYDEMLPRFMNKYGKKWGVKVGEVDLPNLEQAGQKMWSVDVTPEMKESVMQGQPMFHRTSDGQAYGYTQDGKIYIDPRIATSETPIHEYAHLWAEALRRGNAEEWSNVVNLMKGTSIWNDVANNYPELNTDDLLAEEVLAHYSGSRGAARLRKAQEDAMNSANGVFEKAEVASAFDSVRRALSRFWKAVADFLNIHYTSAEEVADRVLNDLLSGVNPNEVASIDGDAEVRFRVIDDQQMIDRLESEPKGEPGYRNVVLNEDGTLGSPMAGKLGGNNGRKATSSFEMNKWEMAEENPDIANENGKVDLIKPNGKTVPSVDYNPYIHIRPTMVNKQFKEAWRRPELVYVQTLYPASELNGEYKAEKAKLSVGRHPWNGGELILSRYDKPVKIMSWEEVADDWMNEFDGKGIHFDIIPPKLLPILAERGAKIIPPHKNLGKECEDAYNAFKAQQEQSGDIRFSISDDVSSEINGKEYNAGVKTFDEAITEGLAELVRKNKDAVQTRADVLHRVNNQLRDLIDRLTSREAAERDTPTPRFQVPGSVRSAAAAQRAFDKSTVDEIVRLTRMLLSKGFIGELPAVEVKRLMGYVNNAVGRKDIIKQAKLVVDLLLKRQLDDAAKALEKQLSVRGSKVGSKGVEVQGRLDVAGQKALKAFKEYYNEDADTIQRRIEDCMNRMSEEGPAGADAAAEYQGLMMAKRYNEDIKQSELEERNLIREIKDENRKMKEGAPETMGKEEFDEWHEAAWEAIRKNRMDRLDAYVGMLRDFGGALRMSVEKAKAFREEEQSRVRKIYHYANSDLEGVPYDEHSKENFLQRLSNAPVFRFLLSPMISFDSMLRFFGRKSPDGRGYLWNHFMSEWVKRNDEEWKNLKKGHDQLDAKAREIFGDSVKRWSDLFTMERGMQKLPVEFWDGGKMKPHDLTQGNMLYIYMVNKMEDGKMKLRRMGISEEDVDRITEIIDPRFIQLADWIQDVFLKEKRIRYNEIHERLFGAPMASIDNYFPLVINKRSRGAEVDIAEKENDKKPATITANIIKRVKNSTALDITNVDAFDLVLAHLQQMEHWAAFAELNRDMNTLLSYRHFRNQVQNMVSAQYGGGEKLLDNFNDACAIAGGAYTPKIGQDSLDKHIVNIAKGVTAAKIAFRLFTAIKQLLSYPAYFSEASVAELAKSTLNPKGIAESWNWAIEKLPGFAERWQSRKAGDNRLDDTELDYAFWKNKIVETASRWGMSPNAFVDGLTVTMGAKAIYETKKKQYIKDGYDEARAEELALRDASVAYNETQQSSGKAYMSPVQLDRTALSVALTVFRNSSMGYQRRLLNSLRNLSRMANPNWAVESEAFTEKQLRRDGLFDAIKERLINEGMDEEKATAEADMAVHEAAERVYNRALTRSAVDVVIFGFIMQFAWNLGSYMPYLIGGDDDDKKKEMLEDAAMHALAGGVEGMAGGSVISEIYNKVRKGDNMSGYNINPLPLMSDIQNTLTKVQSDRLYTINNAVNILMQSLVGVNPETITDIVLAFDDAAGGNLDGLHEFAFLMMRLANFPQSQLDELYIDELDLNGKDAVQKNPAELAKRYAEYKSKRNAPLLYWMYSDAEKDKLQQKFIKRFEEKKKERVLIGGDPEVMSVIDGYKESDAYTKTQEALDRIAAMPKDERKEQRDSLYETEEGAMHRAVTKAETKINSFAKKGNTKAVEYLRSEMARMIEGKISVEDFEEELKGFSE